MFLRRPTSTIGTARVATCFTQLGNLAAIQRRQCSNGDVVKSGSPNDKKKMQNHHQNQQKKKVLHHLNPETPIMKEYFPYTSLSEGDKKRFLEVRDTIKQQREEGLPESSQWTFCNNTIQFGDCYGETYCDEYSCSHKLMRCKCGYLWCGCCFYEQHKYTFCPDCHSQPVEVPEGPTMGKFLSVETSPDP